MREVEELALEVEELGAALELMHAQRDEWHRQNGLLRGQVEAARAKADATQDLLHSIWLYAKWGWVTRQLTTEQRELWADAVDTESMKGQIEDGEQPHRVAERWWRDDFVEGDHD